MQIKEEQSPPEMSLPAELLSCLGAGDSAFALRLACKGEERVERELVMTSELPKNLLLMYELTSAKASTSNSQASSPGKAHFIASATDVARQKSAWCIGVLQMRTQNGARALLPVAGLQRCQLALTQPLACQHPARAKSLIRALQQFRSQGSRWLSCKYRSHLAQSISQCPQAVGAHG